MPSGNGSSVMHEQLAALIPGYWLRSYSPWWTLMPPMLPLFSNGRADLIHAGFECAS